MRKNFGYDKNGNRIFSKFTGLPIQPIEYHIMMIILVLILFSPLIFFIYKTI